MAFNTVIGIGILFGWHRLAMIIHGAAWLIRSFSINFLICQH